MIANHYLIRFNEGLYFGEANQKKQRHGFGLMLYNNNKFYEGMWINDRKNGLGCEFYFDSYFFFGFFNKGVRSGFGKYISKKSKVIYEGYWVNDVKNGYGIMFQNNDTVFIGKWRNGFKHGLGMFKTPKMIMKGVYQNGVKKDILIFFNSKILKSFRVYFKQGTEQKFKKLGEKNVQIRREKLCSGNLIRSFELERNKVELKFRKKIKCLQNLQLKRTEIFLKSFDKFFYESIEKQQNSGDTNSKKPKISKIPHKNSSSNLPQFPKYERNLNFCNFKNDLLNYDNVFNRRWGQI